MEEHNIPIKAKAHVKLTKKDNDDNVVSVEEYDVELTEKEAKELWLSQQQA